MAWIKDLGLDTTHFQGQAHRQGKSPGNKRALIELLVYGSGASSHALRVRLIKEGVCAARCSRCRLTSWMDQPIPLELHHVDGDPKNNVKGNLEILCPNCHALTSNHAGKGNRGRGKARIPLPPVLCDCGCPKSRRSPRCRSCSTKLQSKVVWPEPETLVEMLLAGSFKSIGRELGVSDVAVRKHVIRVGVVPPKRG